jgi:hypothetical protein
LAFYRYECDWIRHGRLMLESGGGAAARLERLVSAYCSY